jgi:hypothetical protein
MDAARDRFRKAFRAGDLGPSENDPLFATSSCKIVSMLDTRRTNPPWIHNQSSRNWKRNVILESALAVLQGNLNRPVKTAAVRPDQRRRHLSAAARRKIGVEVVVVNRCRPVTMTSRRPKSARPSPVVRRGIRMNEAWVPVKVEISFRIWQNRFSSGTELQLSAFSNPCR